MIGRRALLKVLGVAPLAAKHAAAPVAAELSSASLKPFGSFVPIAQATAAKSEDSKAAEWLLANGMPDWAKEKLRREARVPRGLDPDLAANRSFSLVAKVMIQRDRNYDRALVETADYARLELAKVAMRKAGIDLWWH